MSCVFMHKRKIYLCVLDHRRWSAAPTVLSQSWCELILLWSLVWFTSSLSCIALASTRLWISFLWWIMSDREFFDLIFAMFFSFMLLTFVFVLFRGDEDGWWLCSGSVIWFENLEYDFFYWRSRFFSFGVVLMDAYLHSTWLVLCWCFSKGLGV